MYLNYDDTGMSNDEMRLTLTWDVFKLLCTEMTANLL